MVSIDLPVGMIDKKHVTVNSYEPVHIGHGELKKNTSFSECAISSLILASGRYKRVVRDLLA